MGEYLFKLKNYLGCGMLLLGLWFSGPLDTPEKIGWWEESHIWYTADPKDIWQSPEETLRLKKGDCEDFAILAQYYLKQIGMESQIVVFTMHIDDKCKGHGICVFKENGKYNYIGTEGYKDLQCNTIREVCDYSARITVGAEKAIEVYIFTDRDVQSRIQKDLQKERT